MNALNRRGPIESFDNFVYRALHFDRYTHFSDDYRVYASGESEYSAILAFTEKNALAKELWETLTNDHLENFMAGQLMPKVNAVVFSDSDHPSVEELRKFCITYLAEESGGSKTMMGKIVRDAIAKHVGAPPCYAYKLKEERNKMIDDYIDNYGSNS